MERTQEGREKRECGLLILVPVFDDWEAAELLLQSLDRVFEPRPERPLVLFVNDGSIQPVPAGFPRHSASHISGVQILHLRRNLGHQRALAIGLAHVEANLRCDAVVVMDADGSDRPEDIPRLLDRLEQEPIPRIVFAERMRRSESVVFRVFYALYRGTHYFLTGEKVRVGNFSAIPGALLKKLVAVSELWNHYAAAVFVARIPRTSIPTDRGKRSVGDSKMNFVRLVTHGLSAISVWGEVIGVRMLLAAAGVGILCMAGIGVVAAIRLFTDYAIPGWATYTVGILLVLISQAVLAVIAFIFLTLNGRQNFGFLPARDYRYFVDRCDESNFPQ